MKMRAALWPVSWCSGETLDDTGLAAEVREDEGAVLQSLQPNIRLRFKAHSTWSGAAVRFTCSCSLQPSELLVLDALILELCTCEVVAPGRKEKNCGGSAP